MTVALSRKEEQSSNNQPTNSHFDLNFHHLWLGTHLGLGIQLVIKSKDL